MVTSNILGLTGLGSLVTANGSIVDIEPQECSWGGVVRTIDGVV
jgi:hypothetical protein